VAGSGNCFVGLSPQYPRRHQERGKIVLGEKYKGHNFTFSPVLQQREYEGAGSQLQVSGANAGVARWRGRRPFYATKVPPLPPASSSAGGKGIRERLVKNGRVVGVFAELPVEFSPSYQVGLLRQQTLVNGAQVIERANLIADLHRSKVRGKPKVASSLEQPFRLP
jgi:hypothetical protein